MHDIISRNTHKVHAKSQNEILFFAFCSNFRSNFGYPQFLVERYCFHQIFLNCGSCFLDRHLHSHCCLCPKFLSPHAFGAFLHPVLTYLAIPLYSIRLPASSGYTKQAQSFVFNIDCCILITVMDRSTARTCPSADLQILYFGIDASAAAACLG